MFESLGGKDEIEIVVESGEVFDFIVFHGEYVIRVSRTETEFFCDL